VRKLIGKIKRWLERLFRMATGVYEPIDKYAADAFTWTLQATFAHNGARMLFNSEGVTMVFPAAILAHAAIEMYLKAALIGTGCTVFNPANLKKLDPRTAPKRKDCAWDHGLVKLGKQFAKRQPNFDLNKEILPCFPPSHMRPVTLKDALEMFDPFFYELRYPGEIKDLFGIGPMDVIVLNAIADEITPFLPVVH
jgi:hypothetical protein